MQLTNIFVQIFLAGTVLHFVLNQVLELIDYRHRKIHGKEIPPELEGFIDEAKLTTTCEYENAKYFLWIPHNVINVALTLALWFCGFYVALFNWLWGWSGNVYVTAILFSIISSVPDTIVSLPFELYSEFRLEKRFGFSTMTFKLWITDTVKGLLVNAILLTPLMLIMIALLLHMAGWWWVLLGAVYVLFTFGISIIYPLWIAPLFNKFTPVEDEELKGRIEALMQKTGFKASGIFMMDASKRSKHSNAYFTGFGKAKRIVLYDTLVEQLTVDEIEAVLAHELGHYKKKHTVKRLCIMIPLIFAALFVLSVLVCLPALYEGFGFTPDVAVLGNGVLSVLPYIRFIGIMIALSCVEGFSDIADLISNAFSRKDEFEADMFSAELCGSGKPLATALIKLNKENLSEITPPKVYSVFNYNHPPLLERIRAVESVDAVEKTGRIES